MLKKITFFTLAVMLLAVSAAFAQEQALITGCVISAEDKESLPSTALYISDKKHAIFTDVEGRFAIRVAVGDTIRFSFFGHETATYAVSKEGDHDTGDIVLKYTTDRVSNDNIYDTGNPIPKRSATVSGRVISAETGKPIEGAGAVIVETGKFSVTDAAGRFSLPAKVGDTVYFTFPGNILKSHTISKASDYDIGDIVLEPHATTTEDDITLIEDPVMFREYEPATPEAKRADRETATVKGRVISADEGMQIAYAGIYVSDSEHDLVADNVGCFAMEVAVGETVKFTFPGYKPVTHIVSKSGSDYLGDVELEATDSAMRPAVVTGRVTDADSGKPPPRVFAYIPLWISRSLYRLRGTLRNKGEGQQYPQIYFSGVQRGDAHRIECWRP